MTDAEKTAAELVLAEEAKGSDAVEQNANEWAKDDGWATAGQDPWATAGQDSWATAGSDPWSTDNTNTGAIPDATPDITDAQTKPTQGQGAKKKRPNQPRKQSNKPKETEKPAGKERKPAGKERPADKGVKAKPKGAKADATNTTTSGESGAKDNAETAGGEVKVEVKVEEQAKVTQEDSDVKEKEKRKPYINPERFKTGGAQMEKLSPEELTQRMEAIRLKNEQIKQRRAAVEADEQAFNAIQQAEEQKRHATRKVQDQINHTRDEIARRKMERMKDREWDNQKKGGRPGPNIGQNAGAAGVEQPHSSESQSADTAPAA